MMFFVDINGDLIEYNFVFLSLFDLMINFNLSK
ncbi:hypothetical protein H4V97_002804 [Flavobacterium sp. CG_23.5]|nr:hypothetical protein [Flavobacterium sp. CG_23.5]